MRGIVDLGDRLTVKNGTIGAFKDIALDATNRPYLIVEDVRVINSGYGIYAYNGVFTRILNSTVATNVHIGIYCGLSCQIEGTVVSGNGGAGIGIRTGTIFANTIINNGGYGINSSITTGFGNNTLIDNNGGGAQTSGQLLRLYPNACSPVACCGKSCERRCAAPRWRAASAAWRTSSSPRTKASQRRPADYQTVRRLHAVIAAALIAWERDAAGQWVQPPKSTKVDPMPPG
jgi:hypothetical protein